VTDSGQGGSAWGPQDPFNQQPQQPYGQPNPQPGYGQPGYQQPGQYPQQPQFGETQYGPPAYLQGPYGQQPGYGPGGTGNSPPSPNRKSLLITAGVIGAGAIAIVLILVLGGGHGSKDAAAKKAASALSSASARLSLPNLASGLPTDIPTDLPTDFPTDLGGGLPTDLASDLPTDLNGICVGAQSGAVTVSGFYVGLAESGDTSAAQGCVYHDSVPASTTAKLSGKQFTPTSLDPVGGKLVLKGSDGTTVTVTTSRESDGKYYVTSVTIG
jgi:hypothetical protein